MAARRFGELTPDCLADLRRGPPRSWGRRAVPNLSAIVGEGTRRPPPGARPLRHPAAVRRRPAPLRQPAGPPRELSALADCWDLPQDDARLTRAAPRRRRPRRRPRRRAPEVLTFARLALAANEAVRRDCPLWLLG